MSPLPFSFVGFQPLPEGFSSLGFWLSGHWPYLLFLALVGLVVILVRSWSWLLDWEGGRWWPVPASILPAMIPIARTLEETAPAYVETVTVVLLLLAVAVLQIYGQACAQRYRKLADAEVRGISTEVREISARARQQLSFLAEQGAHLVTIADAIGSLADEIKSIKESIRESDS
jgi:uncharacterized membrane protein